MRSVRLSPELDRRLEMAAAKEGVSASELIRESIAQYCDNVLGHTLADDIADVIGIVAGGGGRSDRTGEAFTALLKAKHKRRRL